MASWHAGRAAGYALCPACEGWYMAASVELIAYASRLGGDLGRLRGILAGPLAGLFGGVHVLPFYLPFDEVAMLERLRGVPGVAQLEQAPLDAGSIVLADAGGATLAGLVSVYYVVAEALTNAARHAHASAVSVEVEAAGEALRVTVRDDGAGGAGFAGGAGLVGLKDRVEALGGRIFLDSPHGAGTSLRVELPLAADGDLTSP